MNESPEKRQTSESYNQIRVHFHVCPSQTCIEVQGALDRLATLPGCVDYVLRHTQSNRFQWIITGVWSHAENRNRHYCSEQIQVLFKCLLLQRASLICCSEGQKLHPEDLDV
ncbi:hypothetical protein J3Q09_13570 [Pseudomonas sp. R4-83]|uniref:hypothetical protein n=1 Tax=unclassified Pseudomonas TaxID=196821 RepID=UPI003DA99C44